MILSDETIGLFPFEKTQAQEYRNWVNDEGNAGLLGRALPVTELEHNRWYDSIVSDPNSVVFAVKTLSDDCYLGNVWLHNIHWVNRNAELRILLGSSKYAGHGYGAHACRLLVDFAFRKLGLRKVYLYVSERNPRALRTFVNAGFSEEGHLEDEFFVDGEYVAVKRLAVLNASRSS